MSARHRARSSSTVTPHGSRFAPTGSSPASPPPAPHSPSPRARRQGRGPRRSPGLWSPSTASAADRKSAACGQVRGSLRLRPGQWQLQVGARGANIFCSGHAFLPDGRLLVAGGHISDNHGLPDGHLFNPGTQTWSSTVDMRDGRWSPRGPELAVGQFGRGGVPAPVPHVGRAQPGLGAGVEQVAVRQPVIVADVAAGHEQASVRKEGVPGAEDVGARPAPT